MTTELRLALAVDIDPLTDHPAVTFDDRPGVERPVSVSIANGDVTLTFAGRLEFAGWLATMARQYQDRFGVVSAQMSPEPELVDELGTPLAFGRGRREEP